MTQPLYTVRQLAYVVKDIDAGLKYWTEIMKTGPFFSVRTLPTEEPSLSRLSIERGRNPSAR